MIEALTGLLLCQFAGEILSRSTGLPVPGPVIGMVILFAVLQWRKAPLEGCALAHLADGLLANLGLLFVPAGVGVIAYLAILSRDWLAISMAVVVGTALGIAFTALLANHLLARGKDRP